MTKIVKAGLVAALMAALAGTAEAKNRIARGHVAVPRTATSKPPFNMRSRPPAPVQAPIPTSTPYTRHPRPGMHQTRAPRHLMNGMRVNNNRLFFEYYTYNYGGMPFNGYLHYGMFYPFGCGPVRLDPWTVRAIQEENYARYGPQRWQVWERRDDSGMTDYEPGFEQEPAPQPEVTPAPTPVPTPEPTMEKPRHEFPYSGKIARNQLDDAGSYLLRDYFRATGSEFLVYTEPSATGIDNLEIRDRNQNTILTIRPSDFRGETGPEYVGFINSYLLRMGRDLYDGLDVSFVNYSAGQNRQ